MIRIENLSKTFAQSNTSVDALKNVNIHIEKGDIVRDDKKGGYDCEI